MALSAYIAQTQQVLHDTSGQFYPVNLLTGWINEARQQVAKVSECIRVLPPNSTGVPSYTITNGGSGFSGTITVTVSGPQLINGVQATATATQSGGVINTVSPVVVGSGYVVPPTVTVAGSTGGSGAVIAGNLGAAVFSVVNQEVYPFSAFNGFVQATPGVSQILAIKQIAVYWGNIKPPLGYKPWTWFNAYYRSWPQFANFPQLWSQYGQGQGGSFYLWPIPTQVLGMDLDTICVPLDLTADTDPEAIPAPFTDAIKYFAAYRAYQYAQRPDDAQTALGDFATHLGRDRASVMRSLQTRY